MRRLEDVEDDGLATPEVGGYAEQKYLLLYNYASMFGTSMKKKWDWRVYIDLFSGAGRSKLKDTDRVVEASPLLSLSIPDPFDRYILCELDASRMDALRRRVAAKYPSADVRFICGDSE